MIVAAITAATVFFVGRPFLPRPVDSESEQPSALPSPPAPPAAPSPVPATGSVASPVSSTGSAADARPALAVGDAATQIDADKETEAARASDAAARSAAAGPGPATPEDGGARSSDGPTAAHASMPESQVDKDLARAAWRANRPDIHVGGTRASILIPIKGSIDGGKYKLLRKTRTVVVTLPHAASLNTQHFYRLKRHGFLALWTDQAETNARPEDGTKLRLVLDVTATPQVELRDDYVRVTIPRPVSAGGAEAAPKGQAGETSETRQPRAE